MVHLLPTLRNLNLELELNKCLLAKIKKGIWFILAGPIPNWKSGMGVQFPRGAWELDPQFPKLPTIHPLKLHYYNYILFLNNQKYKNN